MTSQFLNRKSAGRRPNLSGRPGWLALLWMPLLALALVACTAGMPGDDSAEILLTQAAQVGDAGVPNAGTDRPLQLPSEQVTVPVPTGAPDVLPRTLDAPGLASTLFTAELIDLDGVRVGNIDGLVVDVLAGRVHSLAVDTHAQPENRRLLLPWGAFEMIVVPAPNSSASRTTEIQAVRLNVAGADIAAAPTLPDDLLDNRLRQGSGWEQSLREYWAGRLPNLPVTGDTPDQRPSALVAFRPPGAVRTSYPLVDSEDQALGVIEDLVIRPDASLAFGLLRPDPSLGLGDTLLPIDWQALAWEEQPERFRLNVPVETLLTVPQLDSATLPDMTVPGWDQDWQRFWTDNLPGSRSPSARATPGIQATPAPLSSSRLPGLVSTLIGAPLVDRTGQSSGVLADWLLDPNGLTQYVVGRIDQRYVPIPWSALAFQPDGQVLFNLDPAVLAQAPAFDQLETLSEQTAWFEESLRYWNSYVRAPAPVGGTPTPETERRLLSARHLLEGIAMNIDQNAIGPVGDLVLDTEGIARYLVITLGEQERPVPWEMFEYNLNRDALLYLDDLPRLDEAPGFPTVLEINFNAPQWDQAIRMHWGMR